MRRVLLLVVALLLAYVPVTFIVTDAQARIGRPLTPFSVAGVHRRVHRRHAFVAGAALGGAGWTYPGWHSGCTCYPGNYAPGVGGWGSGVGVRPGFGVGAPGFGWHRGWDHGW